MDNKNSTKNSGSWRLKNPEKHLAYRKEWKRRNPGKYVEYKRNWSKRHPDRYADEKRKEVLKKYGISIERFQKMMESQKGKCAGCGGKFNTRICVDHCHNTGFVRGLLCHGCNTFLGVVKDNPVKIRRLVEYVEKNILLIQL